MKKGFTLIELMVTISIVGILVSIALPVYQSYRLKAKFQEVITQLQPLKLTLKECVEVTRDCLFLANGNNYWPTVPEYGFVQYGNPVPGEPLNAHGPAMNIVGYDAGTSEIHPVSMPIPKGDIINPASLIQGNSTYVHEPQTGTSITFQFFVKTDDFGGGINSSVDLILNASLGLQNNKTVVNFTLEGGCKTYKDGPLC